MRPLKLTIILLIVSSKLFSQAVRQYEDFYESGKIYVLGYNFQVDSISSADTGLWTYWYENGNKLSEEIRNYPYLTKYINCWTGNGKQICTNGNGKFYQTWTDFEADSSVFTIRDSIKQGRYISYLPFKKGYRKVAEGTFVNGLRQGDVTYYYETGEVLIIQNYIDNKENGLRKEFYKNGKLKDQGFQIESIRDSVWSFYTIEGILEKKITYERNRQKHLVEYYPNGTIKLAGDLTQIKAIPTKEKSNKGSYSRGARKRTSRSVTVKNGEWKYFDKTGKLIKKERFLNGKLTRNGM
jgi:antitoxin component YwqK of YwqJK toxin-antitoxin module